MYPSQGDALSMRIEYFEHYQTFLDTAFYRRNSSESAFKLEIRMDDWILTAEQEMAATRLEAPASNGTHAHNVNSDSM